VSVRAGQRPQGPPTAWGYKTERVPCRGWNLEVTAIPPKIGPRSEVNVSTESITKEVILSRDRVVSWQWKLTGPAVAWQAMDLGTGTLRNTWSPNHDLFYFSSPPPY